MQYESLNRRTTSTMMEAVHTSETLAYSNDDEIRTSETSVYSNKTTGHYIQKVFIFMLLLIPEDAHCIVTRH
jgi:hypothetical protein